MMLCIAASGLKTSFVKTHNKQNKLKLLFFFNASLSSFLLSLEVRPFALFICLVYLFVYLFIYMRVFARPSFGKNMQPRVPERQCQHSTMKPSILSNDFGPWSAS